MTGYRTHLLKHGGTLLCGFLLGILATTSWHHHRRSRSPKERVEHFLGHFTHRLQLDEKQQTQVRDILLAQHEQLKSLHEGVRPRVDAIRVAARQQIRELLTDTQKPIFDEIHKRHEERRKHHPEHRPPGPPPL